jgi:EmrB/QacA subfamily drug resistance transporter
MATPSLAAGQRQLSAKPRRSFALAVILTAQLMVVLDATIVNVALPKIQTALHFTRTDLSWVLNAYSLTFGGLLLLGARSGDLFGRRRVFLAGIAVFSLGSLAGGFTTSSGLLLAARAFQGVGAAFASPSALALLMVMFKDGAERTRAIAMYTAVSIGGAAVGLVAGGVLVQWTSWRWVFFVNVPIGIALLVLARRDLPETPRTTGTIDYPGALTSVTGMVAVVYGFVRAASDGWGDTVTLVAFAAGVSLLTLFVLVERRAATPITPLGLFANRDRSLSYLARLALVGGMFGVFFFMTQYLQDVLHFDPVETGLSFLPLPAMLFVTSQLAARVLLARFGGKPLMIIGMSTSLVGVLVLTQLSATSNYGHVLLGLVLFGAGNGLAFVPLTMASLAGVSPAEAGAASGLVNVMQQVGGALGLSVLVTVFGTSFRTAAKHAAAGAAGQAHVFVHAADRAFLAAAIMMAVAVLMAVSMRTTKPSRQEAVEADDLTELEAVAAG